MVGKGSDIDRKNRERLYKQWIESDGLSPDDVPQNVITPSKKELSGHDTADTGAFPENTGPVERNQRAPLDFSGRHVLIPIRYVWLTALIIGVLLVALSVVVTILITKLT